MRPAWLLCAALVLAPAPAFAWTYATRCDIAHHVRAGGTELRSASISVSNGDPTREATIERLTIRDAFGEVVHDSGPSIGVAHPLNFDFTPPLDVTVVPPGAHFYLRTTAIWGLNPIPVANGNERGQAMSVTVVLSTDANPLLVRAHVRPRSRERIQNADGSFREGRETSGGDGFCFPVR